MTLTLMAHSQSCQTCIPLKLKKKILFGMSFNVAHGDYLEIPGCFKLHHFILTLALFLIHIAQQESFGIKFRALEFIVVVLERND